MINFNKPSRHLAALAALVLAGCSAKVLRLQGESPTIHRIDTGIANVYLVNGERPILIDTSAPDRRDRVLQALQSLGVEPKSLALVVVTHGHADHAGNAGHFQSVYGVRVAGGRGDLDKFQAGRTDLSRAVSIGVMARLVRPMSDNPYEPFTPDLIVEQPVDLAPFGVPGRILPLPGHTPGSLVVAVGGHLFVGDLVRGGVLFPESPTEHFFHEDRAKAAAQLRTVLAEPYTQLLPGHFGPIAGEAAREFAR